MLLLYLRGRAAWRVGECMQGTHMVRVLLIMPPNNSCACALLRARSFFLPGPEYVHYIRVRISSPPNHRPTNVSSSEASSSSFCCCWGLDRVGTYTRHRRSPCGRVVGQGGHADTARLGRSVYTRRSSSRDRRYAGVTTVPAKTVSNHET